MGLLIDYFVAPADAEAASTLDGGPGDRFPVTDGSGIEPVVSLGMLEEMLTSKSFDAQLADPESRPIVANDGSGEVIVCRIGAGLVEAIASADAETLERLAAPWAAIEEFGGMVEVRYLADFLTQFKYLAGQATSSGSHVYCWVSV